MSEYVRMVSEIRPEVRSVFNDMSENSTLHVNPGTPPKLAALSPSCGNPIVSGVQRSRNGPYHIKSHQASDDQTSM